MAPPALLTLSLSSRRGINIGAAPSLDQCSDRAPQSSGSVGAESSGEHEREINSISSTFSDSVVCADSPWRWRSDYTSRETQLCGAKGSYSPSAATDASGNDSEPAARAPTSRLAGQSSWVGPDNNSSSPAVTYLALPSNTSSFFRDSSSKAASPRAPQTGQQPQHTSDPPGSPRRYPALPTRVSVTLPPPPGCVGGPSCFFETTQETVCQNSPQTLRAAGDHSAIRSTPALFSVAPASPGCENIIPLRVLPTDRTPALPHACMREQQPHIFPPTQLSVPPVDCQREEEVEQRCSLRGPCHLTFHAYDDMSKYELDRSIVVELFQRQRIREAHQALLPLAREYGADRVMADEELSLVVFQFHEMQRMFALLGGDSPAHGRNKSSLLRMLTRSFSSQKSRQRHHRSASVDFPEHGGSSSSHLSPQQADAKGYGCMTQSMESSGAGEADRSGISDMCDLTGTRGVAETSDEVHASWIQSLPDNVVAPSADTQHFESPSEGARVTELDGRQQQYGRAAAAKLSLLPRRFSRATTLVLSRGSVRQTSPTRAKKKHRRRRRENTSPEQKHTSTTRGSGYSASESCGSSLMLEDPEDRDTDAELQALIRTTFQGNTMGSQLASEGLPWVLAVDDGPALSIWNRKHSHGTLLSFRIEGFVESPLVAVVSVLNEQDLFKDWVPSYTFPIRLGLKSSARLAQFGRVDQVDLFKMAFPWPMNDRDACLSIWSADDLEATGSYFVRITTCEAGENVRGFVAPPPAPETERLHCEGALVLQPRSPSTVFVQLLWAIDPGVHLPEYLLTFLTRVFARSAFHSFRRVCVAAINDAHRDRRDLRPFLYKFIQERVDELTRAAALYGCKTGGHGLMKPNPDDM